MGATFELARCAWALERSAGALERLADFFERVTPVGEEPPCAHPDAEREVMPGATLTHIDIRCKLCGAEGI